MWSIFPILWSFGRSFYRKGPGSVCNLLIIKYYSVNLFRKTGIIIAIKLSKQEAKG
jgi:hypothetical protein